MVGNQVGSLRGGRFGGRAVGRRRAWQRGRQAATTAAAGAPKRLHMHKKNSSSPVYEDAAIVHAARRHVPSKHARQHRVRIGGQRRACGGEQPATRQARLLFSRGEGSGRGATRKAAEGCGGGGGGGVRAALTDPKLLRSQRLPSSDVEHYDIRTLCASFAVHHLAFLEGVSEAASSV